MTLLDTLSPLPPTGPGTAAILIALTALCILAMSATRRARSTLRPQGGLPSLARATDAASRLAAVLLGLGAVVALLPLPLAAGFPWVLLAGAVAIGWTARDPLRDVLAWLVLLAEGGVRVGSWLVAGDHAGTVVARTPRAVWLEDPHGRRVAIPNHRVLAEPLLALPDGNTLAEVVVRLPEAADLHRAEQALADAVLLSPWVAPNSEPELTRDSDEPGRWTVRARLLSDRYRARFATTLPERVRDVMRSQEED
jgi:small-conductance mechanosensitive channel